MFLQCINLDFAKSAMSITVFAKQYDKDSRIVEISPLNNGVPYSLESGITARLQMTKHDGTTVINDAVISDGKIMVTLTGQCLTCAGTAVAEIGLYKDSTLLTSQTFYIDVQRGAYDPDSPESSDEYNALVEALDDAKQATTTATATAERAESAVSNANAAIEIAEKIAAKGATIFFETFAPPYYVSDNDYCKVSDIWIDKDISTGQGYRVSVLMSKTYIADPGVYYCSWQPVVHASFEANALPSGGNLPSYRYSESDSSSEYSYPQYRNGDILTVGGSEYECSVSDGSDSYTARYTYSFKHIVNEADLSGDVIRYEQPLKHNANYTQNDLFIFDGCICRYAYSNYNINLGRYNVFTHFTHIYKTTSAQPKTVFTDVECPYETGDLLVYYKYTAANITEIKKIFVCTELYMHKSHDTFYTEVTWKEKPLDYYSKDEINSLLLAKEDISNKVTTLSSESTDTQYPSAKCVYDLIGDIESLLAEV